MSFFSILGGWSMVMDSAQEKMTLGKRIRSKNWFFLKLEAIFAFLYYDIYKKEPGKFYSKGFCSNPYGLN